MALILGQDGCPYVVQQMLPGAPLVDLQGQAQAAQLAMLGQSQGYLGTAATLPMQQALHTLQVAAEMQPAAWTAPAQLQLQAQLQAQLQLQAQAQLQAQLQSQVKSLAAAPALPLSSPQGDIGPLEVTFAVESLYRDQLKPYGRILRKRALDLAEAAGRRGADITIGDLRTVCRACSWLQVQDAKGADWAALLIGRPDNFVDVYSPEDVYPEQLWRQAAVYFGGLEHSVSLPGGRFACAELLMQRQVAFLAGRSLGAACHVVQLAISQKRLLGYSNGTLVPYARSQSMLKDKSAERQRPCPGSLRGESSVATWEVLADCLQQLFQKLAVSGERSLPISNIKRLFRATLHVELSETALGYAKLSELLADARLRDLCSVELQGHGYVVVPKRRVRADAAAKSKVPNIVVVPATEPPLLKEAAGEPAKQTEMEPVKELASNGLLQKRSAFARPVCMDMDRIMMSEATPARASKGSVLCSPSPTVRNDLSTLLAPPRTLPTLLGAASAGKSPTKSTGPKAGASQPIGRKGSSPGASADTPSWADLVDAATAAVKKEDLLTRPTFDGVGFAVRCHNTFISVPLPPSTPVRAASGQRARSATR